jgi:gluconolactonase
VAVAWETLTSGYGLVEGPTYAPDGSLYFSDVLGGGIYRLATDGDVETIVPKRKGVGGLALHRDGGIVCSGRDIIHVVQGETRMLLSIEGLPGWNDICTDAGGRVYAGALRFAVFDPNARPVAGDAWRIDAPGNARMLYDGIVHANGISLAPDQLAIYHSDTRSKRIVVHDLADDGSVLTGEHFIDTSAYGEPDGLAVDEAGCLWVALLGGFGVGRLTPEGELDRRIEVPSTFTTSLCFGGDDRLDLYVVTANNTDDASRRGSVLRTRVDIAGAPVYPASI